LCGYPQLDYGGGSALQRERERERERERVREKGQEVEGEILN